MTVSERPGAAAQRGHKVLLQGIMVSHFSVRLTTYVEQVDVLTKTTVKSAP